jgi:hypothetical protein
MVIRELIHHISKNIDLKITALKPDPGLCPLCGKSNACLSASGQLAGKSCWCSNPSIRFPQGLLDLVPEDKKRKACICKACVLKYLDANPLQASV